MAKLYDALIIGGGPAGLSTALALGRIHRTCAVFSTEKHRNDGAHAAHAILTRDHTAPAEILRLGRKDIERYNNTDFVNTTVTNILRKEAGPRSHFIISDETEQEWKGRTVVIATGVKDQLPDLPGYAENWPHNIYQCPVCDGHELSHLPFGLMLYPTFSPRSASMITTALFLSNPVGTTVDSITSSHVTLFTNGPLDPSDPDHAKILTVCEAHHITLEQRAITRLEPSPDPASQPGLFVHLAPAAEGTRNSPDRIYQRFLLHKPPTLPTSPSLIEQLGLELATTPLGVHIKTIAPFGSTNIPGVFAAGDAGTMMTQQTVAMSTGNAAAAGVVHFVAGLDDEIAVGRLRENKGGNKSEL